MLVQGDVVNFVEVAIPRTPYLLEQVRMQVFELSCLRSY